VTLESGGKTNFLMKTARHCITQKIAKETCYCIWQNFGYYWENPSNFQIISPIFCDAFYLQENLEKNYHHLANCVVNVLHINFFKPIFAKVILWARKHLQKSFRKIDVIEWFFFSFHKLYPRQLQEFMRESEIVSNFSIILIDFIWLRVRTFISRLLRYSGPNFLIIIANRNPPQTSNKWDSIPKTIFYKKTHFCQTQERLYKTTVLLIFRSK